MHDDLRRFGIPAAALSLLLLTSLAPGSASAESPDRAPLSQADLDRMTVRQKAAVLNPLRLVGSTAQQVGREQRQDVFTGVRIAPGHRTVELFLTDPGKKDAFLARVKRAAPKADLGLVEVKSAPSTRTELLRHINRLKGLGSKLPFEIQGIGHSVDGTSIKITASDAAKAKAYFADAPAARLANGDTPRYEVLQGQPRGTDPVLYTRQNDSSPYYAGAALDNAGSPEARCTSGIPAISNWDGRQWLVTAGHCYAEGANVHTNGGRYIGSVWRVLPQVDAAFIEVPTYRNTWDGLDATGYTRYLNGVRSNIVNDEVCQLGYNSKVVCGIRVTNVEYDHGGVLTTVGVQKDGATAARGGDSGGPVITINHPDSRELNGIVRGGWSGSPSWVVWVDVWDIFNAFAIKLNPS
ncbi:trypsin-like peptidase domain-containing protein [Streptomyces sp. NRRL B-1347]|uniref:trypsin-like peptidase domain-containing protein n=1 Tax=Streptomyces sp. NRRL B-1347 TaxID=1476877 RepID=UPI0004C4D837|nr:trypsin-like peptidase domain-containing protein [Streptomyces sp. NRRL B-1347]